ncbi:MAG: HAD family phosphatase [Anaerolineae bacterium]|nr:HAD family phosphatase [Anaerolineae bacterium]
MIKGFIFDFGGVIVRTEDYSPRHAWDERLGLPIGSVERAVHHSDLWVQAQLGRVTYDAYWQGVAELLYMHNDQDNIAELRKDYFKGDRLNYKLVNLIRELREDGYPVVLLSNESPELTERLHELNIYDLFDQVLISALIGVMKPDATAYRVALRALNVAPHEAIFVDDSLANIRGAQALGIQTLLFRGEVDFRAEFAKHLKKDDDNQPTDAEES